MCLPVCLLLGTSICLIFDLKKLKVDESCETQPNSKAAETKQTKNCTVDLTKTAEVGDNSVNYMTESKF